MKSVMNNVFSQVPRAEIPRATFKRSHGCKTTFDEGYLVPVFVDEMLPGDTFNVKMSVFARLATPITPFMDNMTLRVYWFFVPNRLVWDNWVKFMGEQASPGDSTDYLVPQIVSPSVGGFPENTLMDYFGIPTGVGSLAVNALPVRGYQLIRNEWFRDQNLQTPTAISKADGPDTTTSAVIQRIAKRHDQFTSCLPWPQKGSASVIPFASTTLPVVTDGTNIKMVGTGGEYTVYSKNNAGVGYFPFNDLTNHSATQFGSNTGLKVNQSAMGTINQLRQAFQIQRLLERDARGGTRYTEVIYSHFGVTSPDSRLQRPEFINSSTAPININPVAQTAPTAGGSTPQGNLAAFGTVSGRHGCTYSAQEHGYMFGLVAVTADLNYQQGLERHWSYRTRYDYAWPALSHLGEVAVLNKEIYAQGNANPTADAGAFGYNEKDYQYRYKPSIITGLFRSQATGSLDYWHLAYEFTSLPVLNSSFIVEDAPVDRVIATPSEPHFLFDSFFDFTCARPLPATAVPGMVDHF